MTAKPTRRYEHFDSPVDNSEPVIAGVGMGAQTRLKGKVNKWVRLAKLPSESNRTFQARLEEQKEKFAKYRSHLLLAKSFDTRGSRLIAIATGRKRIGYGWMPVLGSKPISLEQSKAIAIWMNSTLGRVAVRRVTGRKIEYPTFNPIAFDGVPFVDIHKPEIVELLSEAYEETCDVDIPSFRDGRVSVREQWDDAVALALEIDRQTISKCADMLAQDPFVSKEAFYEM